MKAQLVTVLLLLNLVIGAQHVHPSGEIFSRIKIHDPDPSVIAALQETGIDLHCGGHLSAQDGDRILHLECSAVELEKLKTQGIQFEVQIPDVSKFYSERAAANIRAANVALNQERSNSTQRRNVPGLCDAMTYPIPQGFRLGNMGGFLYYEEILAALDSMTLLYPHLITPRKALDEDLTTHQGRQVYWVKISDSPKLDESEPEVLYTGLTHAREPATAMSLLYYMWYLLENYERDEDVRRIVDMTELYFVPVLNPDGYVHNAVLSPSGGAMWRKNLHDNDHNGIINEMDGVDLNRNYGYLWGHDNIGSSPSVHHGTYRGTEPFSEPETRMLRNFVFEREFVAAMHDHSYGNDLYYAWEHGPSPLPDADVLHRMSDLMTHENRYLFGELFSTYWLGPINGGANDWFYGEQTEKPKIFSWLPEIGPEFWPDPIQIVDICRKQMSTHLMLAKFALQHVIVHDRNAPSVHYGFNVLTFEVENLGLTPSNYDLSIKPVSGNIATVAIRDNTSSTFSATMESSGIEVQIEIEHRLQDTDIIEFDLVIEIDGQKITEHRVRKYIQPLALFDDLNTNDIALWETNDWGVDTVDNVVCLTDSPGKDQLNDDTYIRLRETLDLSDVTWAVATFQARWNIESTLDFVQMQARIPGGEWTPLCGRYTRPGAKGNDIDIPSPHAGQPEGEPLFDGRQNSWVIEEIDLNAFVGFDDVQIRFVAWSGGLVSPVVEDGFYFRDFEVFTSRKLHCTNQQQDADESGVDCGGDDCLPCITCEDGAQNGDEEGTDCGGTACDPCPTCTDGILNGNEENVDCGGADCDPCPTCTDGILNGDEEDVDCGGGSCAPCPTCADGIMNGDEEDVDCGGTCIPCPSCYDNIQNGNETGIDCGGECIGCKPKCDDGIQNGSETGVDCGGNCPVQCKTTCCPDEDFIWHSAQGRSVNLSPNPVRDALSIQVAYARSKESAAIRWEILDISGRVIAHADGIHAGQFDIDVNDFVPQLYILRVTDPSGHVDLQRFLKVE